LIGRGKLPPAFALSLQNSSCFVGFPRAALRQAPWLGKNARAWRAETNKIEENS
jgi:hypothetical protein